MDDSASALGVFAYYFGLPDWIGWVLSAYVLGWFLVVFGVHGVFLLKEHLRSPPSLRLIWEPRDLWFGCFWDRTTEGALKVYLCPLPCVVFLFDGARPRGAESSAPNLGEAHKKDRP